MYNQSNFDSGAMSQATDGNRAGKYLAKPWTPPNNY